jgi:multicomponent Na+:H+ antiporter subunit G
MNIMVVIFLMCGLLFFTGGSVGIIRLPDFYSRLHPAGKLDTTGLLMTMFALALYTVQDYSDCRICFYHQPHGDARHC